MPRPWHRYFDIFVRHRLLILAIVVAGCLTAMVAALLRPPIFEARTVVMLSSDRPRLAVSPDPKSGAVVERVTEQDIQSEIALLKSPALVRSALEPVSDPPADGMLASLGWLFSTLPNLPATAYRWLHAIAPQSPLEAAVEDVSRRVNVAAVPGSNLIEVTFRDRSATAAADMANRLVATHVDRRVNQRTDALGFFSNQRDLLSTRLASFDQELRSFEMREGIRPLPDEQRTLQEQVSMAMTGLARTSTELAEAEALLQYLNEELRTRPRTTAATEMGEHDPRRIISARLIELELERSALLVTFAPYSDRVTAVEKQMSDARRLMTREEHRRSQTGPASPAYQYLELTFVRTSAKRAALEARRAELERQKTEGLARLAHLDRIGAESRRLNRQATFADEALHAYMRKEEEARFADALDESGIVNVSVVEAAVPPTVPVSDGLLIVACGALLSLLVALGAALVRDRFDPIVRSAGQAARLTGVPVLAEIPRF